MTKAIIVDDEPYCCEVLATLLERYCPELKVGDICYSGRDALVAIGEQKPQVLFLDIEMPQMNGFELLKQIAVIDFEIIFTTSYDKYALQAIRFSALDYLLKPVGREELQQAVQKVIRRSGVPIPLQLDILFQKYFRPSVPVTRLALPTLEGLQLVGVDSIISCAAESNYTIFRLKEKQKLIVSRTLKETEEMLEDFSFLRVHNSSIVNLNKIEKYVKGEGGYLLMSDGSSIDVSRSRKERLLNILRPDR